MKYERDRKVVKVWNSSGFLDRDTGDLVRNLILVRSRILPP